MIDERITDSKSIKFHVKTFLESIKSELNGKKVIDMPAGSGSTTEVLLELGADVEAYDLFPEYFMVKNLVCQRADIMDGIPADANYADWVICQEGMEHFSDQLKALKEFNRILKVGGKLLITVPSYSNLAAKLNYLIFENETGKSMPPNELCDIWMLDKNITSEIYHGHIFLIGLQKLRTLAKLSGLKIDTIRYVRLSKGSLALFPFLYPLIVIRSYVCYFRNLKKHPDIPLLAKKQVFGEQLKININPQNLLNKHTFVVFEKECDLDDIYSQLEQLKSAYSFDKVM
ncbi:MAG: class I SAM-dependent methyltransferase [Methylococcaceae bacterium]